MRIFAFKVPEDAALSDSLTGKEKYFVINVNVALMTLQEISRKVTLNIYVKVSKLHEYHVQLIIPSKL